uniref:NR LBD domain-containing protein n=1 Tax=Macrostomum lignano TaxID=282301 RepID=A0A1I8J5W8_9PLAT
NSCVMLSLLDSMTLSMSTAFHTSAPASDPSDPHAQSWMEAELDSLMMRLLTVWSSGTGPEELMKRLQLASACVARMSTKERESLQSNSINTNSLNPARLLLQHELKFRYSSFSLRMLLLKIACLTDDILLHLLLASMQLLA